MLRVGTIVLNYQRWDDTAACLTALRSSTYPHQWLTVVDNGSAHPPTDDEAATLSGAHLIQTGENLGYAGGNNVGIRRALDHGADLVWIVNPDLRVEPHTLSVLVDVMRSRPEAGIVGPRVTNGGSRPPTVWFNGADVDPETGDTRVRDLGALVVDLPAGGITPTDYVTGACMLVRAEVFADVGLIPDEYFLYFEETELNLRAREHGWEALLVADTEAAHHKATAGGLPSPAYVYYFVRGRLLLARRMGFTGGLDSAERDLAPFIEGWRRRVRERDATWTDTYDQLVDMARHDGRAGRTGRRDDLPS